MTELLYLSSGHRFIFAEIIYFSFNKLIRKLRVYDQIVVVFFTNALLFDILYLT